jgi:hypothetical protein
MHKPATKSKKPTQARKNAFCQPLAKWSLAKENSYQANVATADIHKLCWPLAKSTIMNIAAKSTGGSRYKVNFLLIQISP